MKVQYTRISSASQNNARQLDYNNFKTFEDVCSGSIPFNERKEAKKLLNDIDNITEVHVHSIDRLGRSTLDIMLTIQHFTDKGINVVSTKEGLQTFIEGKENPIAKMIIGILGTLAEFELNRIKERQSEGIAKAKKRGAYSQNGGKPKESVEVFLNKENNRKCLKLLKRGESLRNSAKLSSVSLGTAQKISRMISI